MIVVCNTSPLTNLAAIGQFNLLQTLFNEVYVPAGIVNELSAGGRDWPGAIETETADWVHIKQVSDRFLVDALRLDLDLGEVKQLYWL